MVSQIPAKTKQKKERNKRVELSNTYLHICMYIRFIRFGLCVVLEVIIGMRARPGMIPTGLQFGKPATPMTVPWIER